MSDSTRLNKHLALVLGVSRREADEMIEKGRVTINGLVAQLGAQVTSGSEVTVDSKPISSTAEHVYLAFHKPIGYVCSRKAQGDNPTIYDLIPPEYHALKPVGRLDKDSSGLLLLTNDGDFGHQMTHPSFRKVKIYEVGLEKPLEPLHQQMISDYGIELTDGKSKLILEKQSDDRLSWRVTMHEGRNRQIRRTFEALGYNVKSLHRTTFGNYSINNLKEKELKVVEPL